MFTYRSQEGPHVGTFEAGCEYFRHALGPLLSLASLLQGSGGSRQVGLEHLVSDLALDHDLESTMLGKTTVQTI